jgi:hypothetical protein
MSRNIRCNNDSKPVKFDTYSRVQGWSGMWNRLEGKRGNEVDVEALCLFDPMSPASFGGYCDAIDRWWTLVELNGQAALERNVAGTSRQRWRCHRCSGRQKLANRNTAWNVASFLLENRTEKPARWFSFAGFFASSVVVWKDAGGVKTRGFCRRNEPGLHLQYRQTQPSSRKELEAVQCADKASLCAVEIIHQCRTHGRN